MRPTLYASMRVLDRAVLLAIYLASLWLLVWWDLYVAYDLEQGCNVKAGNIVTAIIAYAAAWCSSSALAPPYGGDSPVARSFLASLVPMALVEISLQHVDVQPRFGPGMHLFLAWGISRDAMFVILIGGPVVLLSSLVDVRGHRLPVARLLRSRAQLDPDPVGPRSDVVPTLDRAPSRQPDRVPTRLP